MNYQQFVRKIPLPDGTVVPSRLHHEDVVARAISRADLADDVRGINASIALIPRTRGGRWPTEKVTEEQNFVDLVWHECEFRDGKSFTYAVYTTAEEYLGCAYLYPMGVRTPLTDDLLRHDVDVSWWVTPDAYERGYYRKVHAALRHWLAAEFPFWNPYFSNREMPR